MTSVTFEGIKYSYNQRQAGIVIAFVVHPENMPDYVALAPLGSRVMVTLTEIADDEKHPEPEKPRQSWDSMKRSQQAGILCSDRQFQEWMLGSQSGCAFPETEVAEEIRTRCRVDSRAKLDTDEKAASRWDALVIRYRQATGQETWHP